MTTDSKNNSNAQVLRDWLSEFKSLSTSSYEAYAEAVHEKHDVMKAIKYCLQSTSNEAMSKLVQPICHQLFEFYRSSYKELKMFAIGLFPAMIGVYLSICTVQSSTIAECKLSLGTYLLSIYNLLCDEREKSEDEKQESESGIEIPNMATASIYHDSMMYPFSERTVNAPNSKRSFATPPQPTSHSSIIPANRCQVMYIIMSCYVDYVALLSECSLSLLCETCLYLASAGYPWDQMFLKNQRSKDTKENRIILGNHLSLMFLRSLYFALYNGCRSEALKAIQAMQKRARYEINPQTLLMCNAILNSVYHEKGQANSTPLGLSVAMTPMMARTASKVMRYVVTAKSIKHYKWKHGNEEVSGDFTDSLQQEVQEPGTSNPNTELDESSKSEKPAASPAKAFKSKLKKSVPMPSASTPVEKSKGGFSSFSEKKRRGNKSSQDAVDGKSATSGVNTPDSLNRSGRFSSTSVPSLKQLGSEDTPSVSDRSNSVSRSTSTYNDVKVSVHDGSSAKHIEASATTPLKKSRSKSNHKIVKEVEMKDIEKGTSFKGKTNGVSHDPQEFAPLLDSSGLNENDENETTVM